MNAKLPRRFALAGLGLLLAIGLSSCAAPIERRIASNPEIYTKLSENDKILVSQGRLREGMTKEAVFLAWGRPDRVGHGRAQGSAIERWTYVAQRPIYTHSVGLGIGMGHGYGRYGYGYGGVWDPFWMGGPSVAYIPYPAATVDFRNSRVSSFMVSPD
jgi:hypothetical protein